jgi:hypothetical protein
MALPHIFSFIYWGFWLIYLLGLTGYMVKFHMQCWNILFVLIIIGQHPLKVYFIWNRVSTMVIVILKELRLITCQAPFIILWFSRIYG